ncbi:MAG: hypothetical protein IT460_12200 [Planctomycetes bacterium]|nr:hypothetical protein [Planctomycetota bacterium]
MTADFAEWIEFSSEASLLEWVRGGARDALLIRSGDGDARRHLGLEVPVRGLDGRALSIGVQCVSYGILPQCLVVGARAAMFVGLDSSIHRIAAQDARSTRVVDSDYVFYEMIDVPAIGLVLAVFEVEVVGINYDGSIRWRRDLPEICGGVAVEGATAMVKLWESHVTFALRLQDGSVRAGHP